jgi:hypothetical protein
MLKIVGFYYKNDSNIFNIPVLLQSYQTRIMGRDAIILIFVSVQ